MKKIVLILGVVLTFPMALLADGQQDGGKGGPGGPGGPHRKHHGPGDGPGQGQDEANGPGQKGGCQKGKGGPKPEKPEQ